MQYTSRYGKENETCPVLQVTYMVLRVLAIGQIVSEWPALYLWKFTSTDKD